MLQKQNKLTEELNRTIERIKKQENLTQQDVAKRLGYEHTYLSQLLNGKKEVSKKFLEKVNLLFPLPIGNEPGIKSIDNNSDQDETDLKVAIRELSESTNRHSIIEERNSRNIERLIALLELKLGGTGLMAPPGTPGTETLNPRKQKANKE